MEFINIIYFLIIVLIFLYMYPLKNIKIVSNNIENFVLKGNIKEDFSYKRCNERPLGKIMGSIFNQYNITKSDNEEYDIYVPCGYNNVESELLKVKKGENKYIFGINGCDHIVSKNYIWFLLKGCMGREQSGKLMPMTFILNEQKDMEYFKTKIYNRNNIYILKKNVQRKEGLKLTKDMGEIMNAKYDNYKVVQEYKTDLYLINKRKVNLRIYLLIVMKEGKKYFYLARDGKCIYTYKEYSNNDLDFESNITSYHLDMDVYKKNPRTFEELREYINKNGDNGDALFRKIDNNMMRICSCISNDKAVYKSDNLKNSITFQLFGIDYIFDKECNPYLLEMNKGPDMIPRDDIDRDLKTKVQSHMFSKVGILPPIKNNTFYLIYEK
jgi:hypothetical protein